MIRILLEWASNAGSLVPPRPGRGTNLNLIYARGATRPRRTTSCRNSHTHHTHVNLAHVVIAHDAHGLVGALYSAVLHDRLEPVALEPENLHGAFWADLPVLVVSGANVTMEAPLYLKY